ncbi:hypothetical protein A2U01_0016325 [Trifolium medium]|uniref:Uncharacterized protein n=1 Tax=Trifolium medium TaxID=97028 RepID=A0A392N6C4_9FABA|nr:hypothetical protein [Trifolium medium]
MRKSSSSIASTAQLQSSLKSHDSDRQTQYPSHIVTSGTGMMGIYCTSRLLSRFPTVIDVPINGLGSGPKAVYTPLKKRIQVQNLPPIYRSGRRAPPDKVDYDPGNEHSSSQCQIPS